MEIRGADMRFGPVSHPQTTGQSEHAVKQMKHALTKWALEQPGRDLAQWHAAVPQLVRYVNSRCHKKLGTSPARLRLGWTPRDGSLHRDEVNFEFPPDAELQAEIMRSRCERRDDELVARGLRHGQQADEYNESLATATSCSEVRVGDKHVLTRIISG